MKQHILNLTAADLIHVAHLLNTNHLVAIPTETVYGLAALATSSIAVAKIYDLKDRPVFNPLICHVSCLEEAITYGVFSNLAKTLARAFWPGPLTLVVPLRAESGLSPLATAGLQTVGLRVPCNAFILDIIKKVGAPLAAPSANPSEHISPTSAHHVWQAFKNDSRLPLILDGGPSTVGIESTILDVTHNRPVLLRAGGLSIETIEALVGPILKEVSTTIKAPGQLKRHYAPTKPMRMNVIHPHDHEGFLAFGPQPFKSRVAPTFNLSESGNLLEAACNLFAMLRQLDDSTAPAIAVHPVPLTGLGLGINDRLTRGTATRS